MTKENSTRVRPCCIPGCRRLALEGLTNPVCFTHAMHIYETFAEALAKARSTNLSGVVQVQNKRKPVFDAKTVGFVYYARVGDLIKIGYSRNVAQRMKSIGGELLACEEGGLRREREMHFKFGGSWVNGELFRPTKDLMDHIGMIAAAS